MKNESIYYKNGGIKFTILVKNGKYHLDFYTPAGERKRKSTKKTVNKDNLLHIKNVLIPDIVFALGQDPTTEEKEQTLDEYATLFFKLEENRITKASLIKDKRWYQNHIYPFFGERLISSIKKTNLDQWQNRFMNSISPHTQKMYKRGYVQNIRSVFNKILKAALYDDLIEKNPFANVPTPRSLKNIDESQIEAEIEPFTKEEMKSILSVATGYMKNFILLMYATGMRPGEIIALEWQDVDFERELIHVTKTRKNRKDKKPKTSSSIRDVEMFLNAKNALKEQYLLTKGEEKVFINELADKGKTKAFANHDSIARTFKTLCQKCEIEGKYLYVLRHTFASTMIAIPEIDMLWISKMMGHKDLSTTLKKYAKFIKDTDSVRLEKKRKIDTKIDIL